MPKGKALKVRITLLVEDNGKDTDAEMDIDLRDVYLDDLRRFMRPEGKIIVEKVEHIN